MASEHAGAETLMREAPGALRSAPVQTHQGGLLQPRYAFHQAPILRDETKLGGHHPMRVLGTALQKRRRASQQCCRELLPLEKVLLPDRTLLDQVHPHPHPGCVFLQGPLPRPHSGLKLREVDGVLHTFAFGQQSLARTLPAWSRAGEVPVTQSDRSGFQAQVNSLIVTHMND